MVDRFYSSSGFGAFDSQGAAAFPGGASSSANAPGAAVPPDAGTGQVWVIDDDRAIRWVLDRALTRAGIARF